MIVLPLQVFPGIYKLDIPIPNNPLKSLNAYVITGSPRPTIIDTGLNRSECIEAMRAQLAELGLHPAGCDYVLTHMHADHSGAIGELAGPDSIIYASAEEAAVINKMGTSTEHWERMKKYAILCGFPEETAVNAIRNHPGFKYGNNKQIAFTHVQEGTIITAGQYELHSIFTPGHTRGHVCLYEPSFHILFSGDHVLPSITPNISTWTEGENPLAAYLCSLDKISDYQVELLLPGHRWASGDFATRLKELKEHHEERSRDVKDILSAEGRMTPYAVASRMRWDLSYDNWEHFPAAQQWFAAGEAAAHLQFLESQGEVIRGINNEGLIVYQNTKK